MREYLILMFTALYTITLILFVYFVLMLIAVQSEYWIELCGYNATIQIVLLIIIRYLHYFK